MDLRQTAIDRTAKFEKFIEHMYLDSVGKVTVGYGTMLPNAAAAQAIPFSKATGGTVSVQEIKDEWTLISTKDVGHAAGYYKQFTKLVESEADAIEVLKTKLQGAASDLRKRFPDLDDYHENAQDALLDMMFNIGLTKFSEPKWPKLFAAVKAEDWLEASKNCNRPDVAADRNAATKSLFEGAVSTFVTLADPSLSTVLMQHLSALDAFIQRQQGRGGPLSNGVRSLEIEVSDQTHSVRVKLKL
jgi:GH24 family phage-related lysozyme (muramidase)